MTLDTKTLVDELRDGNPRALARAITRIENRSKGYRELVGELHRHSTGADIIGVTGSPGSGKSTLVDKLAAAYRERDERVGIIAVDPSSPYSGGAVLGDRIRMGSAIGDDGIFVRSMSSRGSLGGLSGATADAVKAFDAAGMDRVIIETVGAGQNEVDIVKTADTVLVLVPPQSGDTIQMLKAGILEIADVFVVNKADLEGANRIVEELLEMIQLAPESEEETWRQPVIETVATSGTGVDTLCETVDEHLGFLDRTGLREVHARRRYEEEIRTLLRDEVGYLIEDEIEAHGGITELGEAVRNRETDPYAVVEEIVNPLRAYLSERS